MAALADDAVALGRRLNVALSEDELRTIADHLGRVPTATELFAFDAQWSEHCSYKSSRAFLSRLPTTGEHVLLGVGEDAGIVKLGEWNGDTYGVVVAHESHNHPSQVVPFEGAATGIGGVVRDVLCMGAEVIGVADPLRFGRMENAHCRYVAQGVVDGIAAYGNAIGVPNVGGDVFFDASFDDNVLVNVVALGIVKEQDIIHSAAPPDSVGWDIVLVGKATDRSGFGGASFSSVTLDDDDADANKGAVQVPDPFLKNVIMRASYAVFAALRKAGVTAGCKDLGAGGLAGCSAEICSAGGMGAEVDLDLVVTGQPDLPPEVIAIGETQERLIWVVPPSFTPTLLWIYNEIFSLPRVARGACAAVIGKVTDSGRYVATHRGANVMDIDLAFLTGGIRYERPYTPEAPAEAVENEGLAAAAKALAALPLQQLTDILGHRDVASRAAIYSRYDGVVRGCTAIPPGRADAGVLVPVPGSPLGLAVGIGGNPRYGKLHAERAAELSVLEAVASVVAVGATPVGLTDCLNFGDPTVPAQMGAFVAAVDGLATSARALGVPFVSGNVSLYNRSSSGNHVAPSPIVSCIGAIADVAMTSTAALKPPTAGGGICVLTMPTLALGGSIFADVHDLAARALPAVHYPQFQAWCGVMRAAYDAGIVLAARDISDGGILGGIAEMALLSARSPGAVLFADALGSFDGSYVPWFAEMPGFIVQTSDVAALVQLGDEQGFRTFAIGAPTDDGRIVLRSSANDDGTVIDAIAVSELREAWDAPLRDFYGVPA
jgi:phosphoribosylformylglycinamidine synthase